MDIELSKDIIIEHIDNYTSTVFFELTTKEIAAPENYSYEYYDYSTERDGIFNASYKLAAEQNVLLSVNPGGPAHSPYITCCGRKKDLVNITMERIVEIIKNNPIYQDYYF